MNRMTNRCKNITLAKTSFRPVKKRDKSLMRLQGKRCHKFKNNSGPLSNCGGIGKNNIRNLEKSYTRPGLNG